jgi:hypothetical protein
MKVAFEACIQQCASAATELQKQALSAVLQWIACVEPYAHALERELCVHMIIASECMVMLLVVWPVQVHQSAIGEKLKEVCEHLATQQLTGEENQRLMHDTRTELALKCASPIPRARRSEARKSIRSSLQLALVKASRAHRAEELYQSPMVLEARVETLRNEAQADSPATARHSSARAA